MPRLVSKSLSSRATRYIHCRPSPSPTVNVYSTPACQGRASLDVPTAFLDQPLLESFAASSCREAAVVGRWAVRVLTTEWGQTDNIEAQDVSSDIGTYSVINIYRHCKHHPDSIIEGLCAYLRQNRTRRGGARKQMERKRLRRRGRWHFVTSTICGPPCLQWFCHCLPNCSSNHTARLPVCHSFPQLAAISIITSFIAKQEQVPGSAPKPLASRTPSYRGGRTTQHPNPSGSPVAHAYALFRRGGRVSARLSVSSKAPC